MFHNFRSTTERIVTVLMLLVALIACEQAPESDPSLENSNVTPIESESNVAPADSELPVLPFHEKQ